MADPYSTLGVARSADDAAIKKAYRKLAKELHPDRNKDDAAAATRFAEVTRAYDLLSDKAKRAQFDRGEIDEQGNPRMPFGYGQPGGGAGGSGAGGFRPGMGGQEFRYESGGGGGDFSDIFEGLFGASRRGGGGSAGGGFSGFGGRQRAAKGADAAYRLQVDFDEAAALRPQRITLGNGRTVDLKLTPEAVAGMPMRLGGQGEEGPGGRGDAMVTVEVKPHRFFTREGDDVRLELPVRLDEAVAGGKVKAPTVEGAVMLSVPPGSSSGKVLRLKGRGFHRPGGGRGDQLVTLMIDIPADDEALQRFVESWATEAERNPRAALGV